MIVTRNPKGPYSFTSNGKRWDRRTPAHDLPEDVARKLVAQYPAVFLPLPLSEPQRMKSVEGPQGGAKPTEVAKRHDIASADGPQDNPPSAKNDREPPEDQDADEDPLLAASVPPKPAPRKPAGPKSSRPVEPKTP